MTLASRILIAGAVGLCLMAGPAAAQNAAPAVTNAALTPGATATALSETIQVPDGPTYLNLFNEAFATVKVKADAGDAAAAMSVARSFIASADLGQQAQGVDYLEKAAELGVVDAHVQLGNIYRTGQYGITPDRDKAIAHYEIATAAGNTAAMAALGIMILDTQLGPEGRAKALELLTKAAALGDVNANNQLGDLYVQGRGVAIDPVKALEYYQLGVVSGNNQALMAIGDLYRAGSVRLLADPQRALSIYQELARRGDAGALRRIADMSVNGEGLVADVSTGVNMLDQLAQSGETNSLLALGDLFRFGEDVPMDTQRMLDAYQRAADLGNTQGLVRLGDVYRQGQGGVPIDLARAISYYQQAITLGNNTARRQLAGIYLGGDLIYADPEQGRRLLVDAAAAGDGFAAQNLGVLYSAGDVFPADYTMAKRYFDLSVNLGVSTSLVRMATAFATGPLAGLHRDEALEVLETAIQSKVPGAPAELARLQLSGAFPGVGASGAISMLLESARDGDAASARYLVQLYRDGYGALLPPNKQAALDILVEMEPLLGPEGTAYERVILEATTGNSTSTFEAISDDFEILTYVDRVRAMQTLRTLNARAYVYLVQEQLSEAGIYNGPIHGTLDVTTIRAIREVCVRANAEQTCAGGPLTQEAVQVVAQYIYAPKADEPAAATAQSQPG